MNVLSSTSVEITWGPVPAKHRNGIIREYEVAILDKPGSCGYYIKTAADTRRFVKDGLKMHHSYSVKIAARTSVGRGEWSPWAEFTTLQGSNVSIIQLSFVPSRK